MGDLKYRTQYSTTIANDVLARLRQHSKETGVNISRIIDKALREHLNMPDPDNEKSDAE